MSSTALRVSVLVNLDSRNTLFVTRCTHEVAAPGLPLDCLIDCVKAGQSRFAPSWR
jgi:hypothetical protein